MVVKLERLFVQVSPEAEMHIWDDLHEYFPGLIHYAKSQYWNSFHLLFHESGQRVDGEIYFPHDNALMYYTLDPSRRYIEAGCMGEDVRNFADFCARIKEAVIPGMKGRDPKWQGYDDTNHGFDLIREEAEPLNLTPEQMSAAMVLADTQRRALLRTILDRRTCSLESLPINGRSVMEIGQEVGELASLGLVQKDFVVFCKEHGNQISRAGGLSQIEEATRRGFKCVSCGRPMSDERIDILLACTKEGALLARPNHWLSLVVSQALVNAGVGIDQQLIVAAPQARRAIDIFANSNGVLMMLEVKEDPLHLDDAFLFFSRVRYYRPDAAIVLTAQPVSAEVRQYIIREAQARPDGNESSRSRIVLMENTDTLDQTLDDIIQQAQHERFRALVAQMEPQTQVDIGELVFDFFFGREGRVEHEGAVPTDRLAEGGKAGPLATGAPKPLEEQMPVEPVETAEQKPKTKVGRAKEETAADDERLGIGEVTAQEALDQPIVGIQEVMEMEELSTTPYKPMAEEREHVLHSVTEDVATHGIVGRGASLDGLLSSINALPNLTSALVTEDGLLIASALGKKPPPELVAALAAELNDQIQRALEDMGAPHATRILIESMADSLHIRPGGDNVLLVAREERPQRETDEEPVSTLPGEMVLREAMLKKVLEELSMVEEVKSGIVAGRDGLVIDSFTQEEALPPDVLSAILTPIVVDNEKPCKKLRLHPLRQITIRTDYNLYSLIPLDREGILISLLEPGAPREVWQNRLYAAASMLTSVFQ